jgi:predicted enzyme related to lactoylglutathione lyase
MTLQRINFQTIPVKDQDRALAFYRDKLRMTVQTDAPYAGGRRWIFMAIPGAQTLLHFGEPDEVKVKDGTPLLCLITDDVDGEAARLAAAGVPMTGGPADAPWQPGVRWAMFSDSEDNLILIQSSPMEAS